MPHCNIHWPLFRLTLRKANIEIKPVSNFSSSLSMKLLARPKASVFEKYYRGAVAKFFLTFSGFCGVKSVIVINIIMILPFAFMQVFSCWLFLCFISFVLLNFSSFCSSTVNFSTVDVLLFFFILHNRASVVVALCKKNFLHFWRFWHFTVYTLSAFFGRNWHIEHLIEIRRCWTWISIRYQKCQSKCIWPYHPRSHAPVLFTSR